MALDVQHMLEQEPKGRPSGTTLTADISLQPPMPLQVPLEQAS